MQQKTLLSLAALGVIAVLSFFTLRAPEKGERVGPKPRPVAAFKAADVKELELTSSAGKDHVVLKKEGDAWRLLQPMDNAADAALCKTATDQLEKISFGDLVTEKKEKQADFEVGEDKGAHVVAKDSAGKLLFDAWVGKSVSGFTMVRPSGKDEIWQSTGLFKYTYARESKAWRDHAVLKFDKEDVSRLAVEAGGKTVALEKLPGEKDKDGKSVGEAKWKVLDANVKVDPLDDGVANQLVQAMASLVASDFDDATKADEAGLTAPRFKLTATVKGQPISLLIGKPKGEDVWVSVDGKPQVYLLHKYSLERLAQKPVDFREKSMVKAKSVDLTSLDYVFGGETYVLEKTGPVWKATKGGKGDIDAAKMKPIETAFEDFKGGSFADATDDATTGLGKPTAVVTVHTRDGAKTTIKVGALKDGSDYYVAKVGSPDVMMVKKYAVDRFLKKPGDLVKSATPPTAPGPGRPPR